MERELSDVDKSQDLDKKENIALNMSLKASLEAAEECESKMEAAYSKQSLEHEKIMKEKLGVLQRRLQEETGKLKSMETQYQASEARGTTDRLHTVHPNPDTDTDNDNDNDNDNDPNLKGLNIRWRLLILDVHVRATIGESLS